MAKQLLSSKITTQLSLVMLLCTLFIPMSSYAMDLIKNSSTVYSFDITHPDKSFDITTINDALILTLKGHKDHVHSVIKVSDELIASGSADETIKIWNIDRGVCVKTLKGHCGSVRALAMVDHDRLLSSATSLGCWCLKLWSLESGECLYTWPIHKWSLNEMHSFIKLDAPGIHSDAITAIVIIDANNFATGSLDSTFKIFNLETKECSYCLDLKEHGGITAMTKLDDNHIVLGNFDGSIAIFKLITNEYVCLTNKHHHWVTAITTLNDNYFLSRAEDDIMVWDSHTHEYIGIFAKEMRSDFSLVKLDDNCIAFGTLDNTIKIINPQWIHTLYGHKSSISSLVKLDGNRIASGSWDKTIKIWNIPKA